METLFKDIAIGMRDIKPVFQTELKGYYELRISDGDCLFVRFGRFVDMLYESMKLKRPNTIIDEWVYVSGKKIMKRDDLKDPCQWFVIVGLSAMIRTFNSDIFNSVKNIQALADLKPWGDVFANFKTVSQTNENIHSQKNEGMLSLGYILCLSRDLGNLGGRALEQKQMDIFLSEEFYDPRTASGEKVPCAEWTQERRKELLKWYCEEFYPKYNNDKKIELPTPKIPCHYCGKQRPEDDSLCENCHLPLYGAKCPECGEDVHEGNTSCGNCGYPFPDGAELWKQLQGTTDLNAQLESCKKILGKFANWKKIQKRKAEIEAELKAQREREEAERKARQEREEVLKNLAVPDNFQATLEGKNVKLTWGKAAAKVEAIRIFRCRGRKPSGYEEGLELVGKDLPRDATDFVDKTVEGGEYYGYVICPVAYGENGWKSTSTDICTALPPEAFTISPDDGQLDLSWKSSALNSSVQPVSELKRQDCNEWMSLGKEYSYPDKNLTNGQKYTYQLRFVYECGGRKWYSQAVEASDIPKEAPPVPEIQKIQVERCSAEMIKIRWEWPDGIEAVRLVRTRSATKPKLTKQDILERGREYTKSDYEREGCYTWKHFNDSYYLTVFTVQKAGTGERFSKEGVGTAILADPVTISYKVVKKGLLRSKFFLELESDGEGFPNLSYVLTKSKFLTPNGKYEKLGEIKSQSGNQLRIELPTDKQGYVQLITEVANDHNFNLKRVGEQIPLGK